MESRHWPFDHYSFRDCLRIYPQQLPRMAEGSGSRILSGLRRTRRFPSGPRDLHELTLQSGGEVMGFHHCRLRGTLRFKLSWGIAPAPSVKVVSLARV